MMMRIYIYRLAQFIQLSSLVQHAAVKYNFLMVIRPRQWGTYVYGMSLVMNYSTIKKITPDHDNDDTWITKALVFRKTAAGSKALSHKEHVPKYDKESPGKGIGLEQSLISLWYWNTSTAGYYITNLILWCLIKAKGIRQVTRNLCDKPPDCSRLEIFSSCFSRKP